LLGEGVTHDLLTIVNSSPKLYLIRRGTVNRSSAEDDGTLLFCVIDAKAAQTIDIVIFRRMPDGAAPRKTMAFA
jgi:hypothetical protein